MASTLFVNDAKVMSKGQVTIPKNVRAALGIETGDRVTFIVEGNEVKVVNSAVYARDYYLRTMLQIGLLHHEGRKMLSESDDRYKHFYFSSVIS